MKKICLILVCSVALHTEGQVLFDSFTDGDFTSNPGWQGSNTSWVIVTNSDVAAGAAGSNTLRLNAAAVSGIDYLSAQPSAWGDFQEWGFFLGRRSQPFTLANQAYFWLFATEATLNNTTVDGYRVSIGDDTGADEIRLELIVNGAVQSTVLTAASAIPNGLTDIGLLIRVRHSASGLWELYTSSIPLVNGTGAVATGVPNSSQAPILQGSAINNVQFPQAGSYLGVSVLHSSGAAAVSSTEFDQVYFTAGFNSNLPVRFGYFNGTNRNEGVRLNWTTLTELNCMGFEVQRSYDGNIFTTIGFVYSHALNGNSSETIPYSFIDTAGILANAFYRLRQIDLDTRVTYSSTLFIKIRDTGNTFLKVFPNPVVNHLNILIHIKRKEKVQLIILDVNGRGVCSRNIELEPGDNSITIEPAKWGKGIYFVQLLNSERMIVQSRFIKK